MAWIQVCRVASSTHGVDPQIVGSLPDFGPGTGLQ